MPRARRGFSITEMAIAMLVLAVLTGAGVGVYSTVQNNMDRVASMPNMAMVQLEVRRTLAANGATILPTDVVSALDVPGVEVQAGASSSPDVVSAFRYSDTVLVVAAGSQGGCTVLVDRLAGEPSWLVDRELTVCSAQAVSGQAVSEMGGTAQEPLEVALS